MNEFIFHNVGQGLFYSGHLNNNTFNFIYDCGSVSGINYINVAIDSLPAGDIDFVLISHLHADHINGLNYLLRKRNVKKIYLPYLGYGNKHLIKLIIAYSLIPNITTGRTFSNKYTADSNEYISNYHSVVGLFLDDNKILNDTDVSFVGKEGLSINSNVYSEISFTTSLGTPKPYWKFVLFNKRQSDTSL